MCVEGCAGTRSDLKWDSKIIKGQRNNTKRL